MTREFKCCGGISCLAGSDMFAMEIRVEAPVGQVIGYVKQQSVDHTVCLSTCLSFFLSVCVSYLHCSFQLVLG